MADMGWSRYEAGQEAAHYGACYAAAAEAGLTPQDAEACTDGDKACAGCPWFARVFVYGTLLRGEANHYLLERAECVAADAVAKGLALYVTHPRAAFPYAQRTEPNGRVRGEVWRVDAATLVQLDRLEGVASGHYMRELRDVHDLGRPVDAPPLRAWVYIAAEPLRRCARIPSGSWRAHRRGVQVP